MTGSAPRPKDFATVFVDDFVTGRLPAVCALSGEPTSTALRLSRQVDGPSAAWALLIFLGPIGWLVMVVVYVLADRSYLSGTLPMTAEAYQAAKMPKRWGVSLLAAAVGFVVIGLLVDSFLVVWIVLAVAAGTVGAMMYFRARWTQLDLVLDASRRWVTIRNVHPRFTSACRDRAAIRASR